MSMTVTLAYGWQITVSSMKNALDQWRETSLAYKTMCLIEHRKLAGTLLTNVSRPTQPIAVASISSLPYEIISTVKYYLFQAEKPVCATCECCAEMADELAENEFLENPEYELSFEALRVHHSDCDDCFELEMDSLREAYDQCVVSREKSNNLH